MSDEATKLVSQLRDPGALRALDRTDAEAVLALYRSYRKETYSLEKVRDLIGELPAFGLFDTAGTLQAYIYTEHFAPDVIQIGNVFVAAGLRNRGLGAILMAAAENAAQEKGYRAAILSNSLLYETKEDKEAATGFYKRGGYRMMLDTGPTKVFFKELPGQASRADRR